MKMLILMLCFLSSSLFMFMKHPLSLGFMLLVQTIMSCMISSFNTYSCWFSYVLFITFVGGMLVLFIYVASVASNEKFMFSSIILFSILLLLLLISSLYYLNFIYIDSISNHELLSYNNNLNLINKELLSIMKMFNFPTMMVTILTVIYLLITMISIVKIININEGPLRMKN